MLRLFGGLSLEGPGGVQTKFPTRRSALLLARLGLSKNQRAHRDELSELLWPDDCLEQSRIRLRQELLRLRQTTGEFSNHLRSDRNWVEIEPGALSTDTGSFEEFLGKSATATEAYARIGYLRQAMSLASGSFLSGYQDSWVEGVRRNFTQRTLAACMRLAECLAEAGLDCEALEANRRAVALEPLDTAANTQLIKRLIEGGQPALARQQVHRFDGLMCSELGHGASAEVWALIQPPNHVLPKSEEDYWKGVSEWAFDQSRQLLGPGQDPAYSAISSEIDNLRRGIRWGLEKDPKLAAFLVVSTWRTVSGRGQPSIDGDLLYRAAQAGAHLLPHAWGGEALAGAGITLSAAGRTTDAEHAFEEAIRILDSDPTGSSRNLAAWVKLNFGVNVVHHSDSKRAMQILRGAMEEATRPDLKAHVMMDYAVMLANDGNREEAIRVGEEAFAVWVNTEDQTTRARAHGDLGELYWVAGQPHKALPLMVDGTRMLRETGVQYMLSHHLICLSRLLISLPNVDWDSVSELLDEATVIAERTGSRPRQLEIERLRLVLASRTGDGAEFVAAVTRVFELTRFSQSAVQREESLNLLALELSYRGRLPFANAIRKALGLEFVGPCAEEWAEPLATEPHSSACTLAVRLANDAELVSGPRLR